MYYEHNKNKYHEILLKSIIDRLNNLENKDNNFQSVINKYNLEINNNIDLKVKNLNDKIIGVFNDLKRKQNSQYIQTHKRISQLEHNMNCSLERLKHIPTISRQEIMEIYNKVKSNLEKNKN